MAKKDRFQELLSIFSVLNKNERDNALILAEAFKNRSNKKSEEAAQLLTEINHLERLSSSDKAQGVNQKSNATE